MSELTPSGKKQQASVQITLTAEGVDSVRLCGRSWDNEPEASEIFQLVHEGGPDVLRVSGHIVNLVVDVQPVRADEKTFVTQAGEMTVILDVRDSKSLAPLTRIVDRRSIQPATTPIGGGYESGYVSNWGGVRDVFGNWLNLLVDWLEDLHGIVVLPPAPPDTRED